MPHQDDYLALAKEIKKELDDGKLAFRSYARMDLTQRLRKISGEPNTRIKAKGMAKDIEQVFAEQGIRMFPKLSETTTADWVRIWRAGTVACDMLDLILKPGQRSDHELANTAAKIKGRWDWGV